MLETRRSRGGARPYRAIRRLLIVMALSFGAVPVIAAPGDISKRFKVNEDNPSANVPSLEERNANPVEFGYYLQDLYTRAELAFDKKDYAGSVKYFEAIAKTIPDRALSFSKLCQGYQQLGKLAIAAANCGKAIQLEGATLYDHLRFIDLTLGKGPLLADDVTNIDASIVHVASQVATLPDVPAPPPAPERIPGKKLTAAEAEESFTRIKEARALREQAKSRAGFLMDFELLRCRFALRLRDVNRLDACLTELKSQKANEQVVLPFDWSKAVIAKDQRSATALLERAKQLQIPAATLGRMADEQEKAFRAPGLIGVVSSWGTRGVLLVLAGFALCVGIVVAAKRRKLSPARV